MRKYKMNRFRPEKIVRRGWLKSQKYAGFCDEIVGFYVERIWVENESETVILFQNGIWIRAEI